MWYEDVNVNNFLDVFCKISVLLISPLILFFRFFIHFDCMCIGLVVWGIYELHELGYCLGRFRNRLTDKEIM